MVGEKDKDTDADADEGVNAKKHHPILLNLLTQELECKSILFRRIKFVLKILFKINISYI